MNLMPLSAYLVEDEPLCRADFREAIKAFPEINLLGETDTLSTAEHYLSSHRVDVLFLDLSIGRQNGLDLVERLTDRPLIVALTAHPQHAVRGFSLDLVDYILKPVERERLASALDKVRQRKFASQVQPGQNTFVAEWEGKKTIFELSEILGIESMGNYVILHTPKGKAIKRATFKEVRKKLPANLFVEVARGRSVAIRQIQGWRRDRIGKLILQLRDSTEVTVSQNKTSDVLAAVSPPPHRKIA